MEKERSRDQREGEGRKEDENDLSEDLKEVSKLETGEDETGRHEALHQLRQWISNNPRIKTCPTDAGFLLRFLRMKKFDVEGASVTLERYLRMRQETPEWYRDLDILHPPLLDLVSSGCTFVLPGRDLEGRRVIFHIAGRVDVHKHKSLDIIRTYHLILESLVSNPEEQVRGFTYIFDFKDVSIPYVALWTPNQFQKAIGQGERYLPMRHKSVNLANPPLGFWVIYEFAKHCLSDKIRSRLKVYHTDKYLVEKIAKENLPREYGGTIPATEMGKMCKEELLKHREEVLALDGMEYEVEKEKKGWSLAKVFGIGNKNKNHLHSPEEEWHSSFKVPSGLPLWLTAVMSFPGLPKLLTKFSDDHDVIGEVEGHVQAGDHVQNLMSAKEFAKLHV
ncbi:unnamed protein product [Darwinula stevensoni]|uniref:CRAL-TRIO domain-containing protein n=1 Tax=Darwinula stevensoni TaxID=69355 RepID=A0A7R8XAE7_9CRUS|nr:unnamed protein product [Darwinula stevensoni]CAG0890204.1 unnamed protein product [Darwinula stevensoni]